MKVLVTGGRLAAMNRKFLLVSSFVLAAAAACARNPRAGMLPEPTGRCADLADTVSKYVSQDALPLAHLVGNPARLPRVSAALGPGDSVYVEFVVRPNGMADTSTVQIFGPSDPEFARGVAAFAIQSRFKPAEAEGCSVLSKYNLVVRAGRAKTR
jgi:hypothetical protein